MCGIFGYLGPQKVTSVILKGLKSIEYRGYDSSGITFYSENGFQRIRSQGHLRELEKKLPSTDSSKQIGIGHTRWATHGIPNEANAHPQKFGSIHIVHNGIIENAKHLKKEFPAEYTSQTDSEIIARLIQHFFTHTNSTLDSSKRAPTFASTDSNSKNIKSSVIQTLKLLKGKFSFLALSESSAQHLIGCRNGPPLIVGLGQSKEFFISSDLPSLAQWTNKLYILENQEIFEIKDGICQFYSFDGNLIQKNIFTEAKPSLDSSKLAPTTDSIDSKSSFESSKLTPTFASIDSKSSLDSSKRAPTFASTDSNSKNIFPHFMLKEIFEQALCVQSTLQSISLSIKENHKFKEKIKNARKLYIVACGSSFYAALYGKYVIERLTRISVEIDLASEFQYRSVWLQKEDPILFISQSGETADILSCVKKAQQHQAFCIALCNVKNSSLDRMAHESLYLEAGIEKAVASTKAFSSSLSALITLALELAHTNSLEEAQEISHCLHLLPQYLQEVLKQNENLKKISQSFKKYKSFLFLGRGHHYPIALEGALKLKELAYVHAEGYPFGEMKHGPLALVDDHVLTIGLTSQGIYFDKNLINLEEIKARKGSLITIGTNSSELDDISVHHITIPQVPFLLSPLLEVIPLQLLAYHYASFLGHHVDQPRNLAKSVTVE